MVIEEQVFEKLKTVMDPEMMINIVDMGLIYKIEIFEPDQWIRQSWQNEGIKVKILMTLTSPTCPLASTFDEMVSSAVKLLDGVSVCEVELTFEPVWSMSMMSDEAKWELGIM